MCIWFSKSCTNGTTGFISSNARSREQAKPQAAYPTLQSLHTCPSRLHCSTFKSHPTITVTMTSFPYLKEGTGTYPSVVAVGTLNFPRKVFDLSLQLSLLVFKLYGQSRRVRRREGCSRAGPADGGYMQHLRLQLATDKPDTVLSMPATLYVQNWKTTSRELPEERGK